MTDDDMDKDEGKTERKNVRITKKGNLQVTQCKTKQT